ncbi:hypothetical protein Ancab_002745 [Ancistrocladus abbreviatus]
MQSTCKSCCPWDLAKICRTELIFLPTESLEQSTTVSLYSQSPSVSVFGGQKITLDLGVRNCHRIIILLKLMLRGALLFEVFLFGRKRFHEKVFCVRLSFSLNLWEICIFLKNIKSQNN